MGARRAREISPCCESVTESPLCEGKSRRRGGGELACSPGSRSGVGSAAGTVRSPPYDICEYYGKKPTNHVLPLHAIVMCHDCTCRHGGGAGQAESPVPGVRPGRASSRRGMN